MSPRRNRTGDSADRSSATPAPMGSSLRRVESYRGEDWVVQTVAGSPGRYYRCPGCDQEIPPGVGHVVAWPDHGAGVEDRRHWHRACWGARERRTTAVQRGRGTPRY
ncbi:ATP/GTP-binding protein [Kitasatospora acidiphila]|uniref:ATP/GTP-binding protein n=1 Tax=Kitasatospora acidiphila TaxID=2567942 RepID=UPI003C790697